MFETTFYQYFKGNSLTRLNFVDIFINTFDYLLITIVQYKNKHMFFFQNTPKLSFISYINGERRILLKKIERLIILFNNLM